MRKRLDNNAILSITATIVSVCALFVATYQTILMRQQQSASVWPKLVFSNAYYTGGGFYRLTVRNVGIGPAIIRNASVKYENRSFGGVTDYAEYVLAGYKDTDSLFTFDNSDLDKDDVIPPGEKLTLINVRGQAATRLFLARRPAFSMTVAYESVYGEQWKVQYGPFNKTK